MVKAYNSNFSYLSMHNNKQLQKQQQQLFIKQENNNKIMMMIKQINKLTLNLLQKK